MLDQAQPLAESHPARREIWLWAVVPSCLLATWMYAFPTQTYSPDRHWGYFWYWGVFNSWASILAPLAVFAMVLWVRLRVQPVRKPLLLVAVIGVAILWWIVFAAVIKATFLRLAYLSDVVRVGWQ